MFNWLIKILGGVPKKDNKKLQADYELLKNTAHVNCEDKIKALQNKVDVLKNTLAIYDGYATISFIDTGDYNFSVNSKCPYSIMVKKGTNVVITGYKGNEKLDKINIEEK